MLSKSIQNEYRPRCRVLINCLLPYPIFSLEITVLLYSRAVYTIRQPCHFPHKTWNNSTMKNIILSCLEESDAVAENYEEKHKVFFKIKHLRLHSEFQQKNYCMTFSCVKCRLKKANDSFVSVWNLLLLTPAVIMYLCVTNNL